MQELILDISVIKYVLPLYAKIKKDLKLPEWCGNNLDALWDLLYIGFDEKTMILIKGYNTLSGDATVLMDKIIPLFVEISVADSKFNFTVVD